MKKTGKKIQGQSNYTDFLSTYQKDPAGNGDNTISPATSTPTAKDFSSVFALIASAITSQGGSMGSPSLVQSLGVANGVTLTRGEESFHPKYLVQKLKNVSYVRSLNGLTPQSRSLVMIASTAGMIDFSSLNITNENESLVNILDGVTDIPSGIFGPAFQAGVISSDSGFIVDAQKNLIFGRILVSLNDSHTAEVIAVSARGLYEGVAEHYFMPKNVNYLKSNFVPYTHANLTSDIETVCVPHLYGSNAKTYGGNSANVLDKVPIFNIYNPNSTAANSFVLSHYFGQAESSLEHNNSRLVNVRALGALALPLAQVLSYERLTGRQSRWIIDIINSITNDRPMSPMSIVSPPQSLVTSDPAYLLVDKLIFAYNRLSKYGTSYNNAIWSEESTAHVSEVEYHAMQIVKTLINHASSFSTVSMDPVTAADFAVSIGDFSLPVGIYMNVPSSPSQS